MTTPFVKWKTYWLFDFDHFLAEEKKDKNKRNISTSKGASQIKFYIKLECEDGNSVETQLIWQYMPGWIGLELYDDLTRLKKHPFQELQVNHQAVSGKGKLQEISLHDIGTLEPTSRQDRGSLVSRYDSTLDIAITFPEQLKLSYSEERITQQGHKEIQEAWKRFRDSYSGFMSAWFTEGMHGELTDVQCDAYSELLSTLMEYAQGDLNRRRLLSPILKLGTVRVTGRKPIAIIVPWHPLRLKAMAVKMRQVVHLLRYVITTDGVDFGDIQLFFKERRSELLHPYYPEVGVGFVGCEAVLLSTTDTVNEYSLLEQPVRDERSSEAYQTNDDGTHAAKMLLSVTQRYLELMPHERANLSIVLYNCDSTGLPRASVNALSELFEDGDDLRCQIVLRHQDRKKLGTLYEKMVESLDSDVDDLIPSEASRDFMARLRIEVMAEATSSRSPQDGKPADIVFLDNVISRQAKQVWIAAPITYAVHPLQHVPSRWSRRRPASRDELKSTVYLTCPVQPEYGWTYLDAVYNIVEEAVLPPGTHNLPARQISFQDNLTNQIFNEIHRLGEWVVNYDELLERRQLVNQNVQVIRYQQNRGEQRGLVISSDSQLELLTVLVRRRLESLSLGWSREESTICANEFIKQANRLSGDIVLRAAKRGQFASELMGVVLSRALLHDEIGFGVPVGWYFLDDYASWLGQKEEQIADILALFLKQVDGQNVLGVMISECKYVDASGVAEARTKSMKQLRDTVSRVQNALCGDPPRLDADLWLSRLGDLLVDRVEVPSGTELSVEEWVNGIRSGSIPIEISGYSHVFISGPADNSAGSERQLIARVDNCVQEIYSREQVRKLVIALHKGQSFVDTRRELGDEGALPKPHATLPNRIQEWSQKPDIGTNSGGMDSSGVITTSYSNGGNVNGNGGNSTTDWQKSTSQKEVVVLPPKEVEPVTIHKTHFDTVLERVKAWAGDSLARWIAAGAQPTNEDEEVMKWLADAENRLKLALNSYGLQAKVLSRRLTPNAGIIHLAGSERLTCQDIIKRRSELLTDARFALTVLDVVPRPGEIMVFLCRQKRQVIHLRSLWARRRVNRHGSGINLSFVVGIREADGELLYLNLGGEFENSPGHAPHTLIAGETGSGKSILLQNLLLDIAATNSPDLAKIYLIDPKMGVDYPYIEGLPHLKGEVIVNPQQCVELLEEIVREMDRRYSLLRLKRASNLMDYNLKVLPEERIPVLFVVHDEFADWMQVSEHKEKVEGVVGRLGVKARASGIHLIFAAQRPDNQVFPMQLRSNLGNRLVLKVRDEGTSEIALGSKGAERLLGKGHLLASLSSETGIYAQVPYLSVDEQEEVVNLISRRQIAPLLSGI